MSNSAANQMTDPTLYQALADIGCKVCGEQLGCCLGGPPGGLPKLADMILSVIHGARMEARKERPMTNQTHLSRLLAPLFLLLPLAALIAAAVALLVYAPQGWMG